MANQTVLLRDVSDSTSPSVAARGQQALRAFRGDARAGIPLHPLETTLVTIAILQLCFLPWAFAGMHMWAQLVSFGLGLTALAVAVQRRIYREPYTREGNYMLFTLPRLWRFPVFWLGLGFFTYITIQGLNPAYVRMSDERGWWMEFVEYKTWLPSGISTPFEHLNSWRVMIIWGGAWLLVCSLWIGLTRRKSVTIIITALVINGTALALIGILQKVTKAKEILWSFKVPGGYFVSTIIYKNHAAAYFYLILALAAAFILWHVQRGSRRQHKTSPASVYAFCAGIIGFVVMMSMSKGAILLTTGYLVVCLLGFVHWLFTDGRNSGHRIPALIAAGLLVAFLSIGSIYLGVGKPIDRIQKLFEQGEDDASVGSRLVTTKATYDMAKTSIWTGWGAGSFQHIFPAFQQNYPELGPKYRGKKHGYRPQFWRYAHNDYLQSLAEYGIIGLIFPAGILGWWFYKLCQLQFYRRRVTLLALGGLLMVMVHCWVDFQLQCPAIIVTWCAGWALITRWAELERA